MRKRFVTILGCFGLLGFGCGVERLDAGQNKEPDASTWTSVGVPFNGVKGYSFGIPCDFPAPSWLAGEWNGAFDSYTLPSGAKAVRLEVTGARRAGGGLCGTMTFGSGPALPVATDPTAPPPVTQPPFSPANAAPLTTVKTTFIIGSGLVEGFPYEFVPTDLLTAAPPNVDAGSVTTPAVEGTRVRFGITVRQVFKSWCNLQLSYQQTPFPPFDPSKTNLHAPSVGYECNPPDTFDTFASGVDGLQCDGLSGVTVRHGSCAQAIYCLSDVCVCDPGLVSGLAATEGCTITPSGETRFDLHQDGAALVGSVVLNNSVETLRLER